MSFVPNTHSLTQCLLQRNVRRVHFFLLLSTNLRRCASSSAILCHFHSRCHRRCLRDPHFLSSGCASTLITPQLFIVAKRAIVRWYMNVLACSRCRQYPLFFVVVCPSRSLARTVVDNALPPLFFLLGQDPHATGTWQVFYQPPRFLPVYHT